MYKKYFAIKNERGKILIQAGVWTELDLECREKEIKKMLAEGDKIVEIEIIEKIS